MSTATWRRLRILGGVLILALLVWRVGTAPVLDGLRAVDARSLLLASAIAVPTTVCSAWRWRLVARAWVPSRPSALAWPATTARSSSTRYCPAACWATYTAECRRARRR
jgi:hypothetical protein